MPASTRALTRRPARFTTLIKAALVLASSTACRKVKMAEIEAPAPCPEPEVVEPEVFAPMVHGVYAGPISSDSSLYVGKSFDFVGPVVRVRIRYLSEPEGTIEASRYSTCEAEVEVPVRWTEAGFVVAQTVTVTAHRGDFERTEGEPLADGSSEATHHKILSTCWVSVLEGEYWISELSSTTSKGRPDGLRLIEPNGQERVLEAVEPPSERDFMERADEYFWSR